MRMGTRIEREFVWERSEMIFTVQDEAVRTRDDIDIRLFGRRYRSWTRKKRELILDRNICEGSGFLQFLG